ncbi:TolC family protein [Zooshikella harenae]|uniref:TolC family protein n=1 Tax=Zooshikella harenae TaxID=2827238 RepID=A0ABS5ZH21_9GAMM|nr:TolC family protein [Zooshikella harenae]MBU2713361.1 TolC family protein [Zooshikella harenae]
MTSRISLPITAGIIASLISSTSYGASLSLQQAIHLAQKNDPWLTQSQHIQAATTARQIAAGTLPDPKMSVGLANLPTDTFDFDQEPMTQLKVGVSQMFPRGNSLALKQQQLKLQSQQHPFMRQDRKAKVAANVSQLWFDAYLAQESIALINRNRSLFEQLAGVAQANYASAMGKSRQQDIIRAQLELTRLDDRLTNLLQQQEMQLQALSEWTSDAFINEVKPTGHSASPQALSHYSASGLALTRKLPNLHILKQQLVYTKVTTPQTLAKHFMQHPAVKALDQQIQASQTEIKLAEQKYKPEWGVNASYSYRDDDPNGNDRADFFSVGVTFDLPLFTANRQDKEVQAAASQAEAIKTEKWLLLRNMIARFETAKAQLKRLDQRLSLYQSQLLPQMHQQAEAALTAYTNDDGDFAEVVRARIAELNAEIDALTIHVAKQKTIAQLNYFFTTN